jgi:hypothetical protein
MLLLEAAEHGRRPARAGAKSASASNDRYDQCGRTIRYGRRLSAHTHLQDSTILAHQCLREPLACNTRAPACAQHDCRGACLLQVLLTNAQQTPALKHNPWLETRPTCVCPARLPLCLPAAGTPHQCSTNPCPETQPLARNTAYLRVPSTMAAVPACCRYSSPMLNKPLPRNTTLGSKHGLPACAQHDGRCACLLQVLLTNAQQTPALKHNPWSAAVCPHTPPGQHHIGPPMLERTPGLQHPRTCVCPARWPLCLPAAGTPPGRP